MPTLSGLLLQNNNAECTLLIHVNGRFKLQTCLLVNRARKLGRTHVI